jgi:hypothetical protein
LIAEILFGFAAYTSFATLEKIKTSCVGVADDDMVSVESDVNTITTVFQILSQTYQNILENKLHIWNTY